MMLFILILLIPTSLSESRTAKLALLLALAIAAIAHLWPVWTRRALAALPFLLIEWPFAAQKIFLTHYDWLAHLPKSWHQRMEIWDYMSYRIMEKPLLGWGLGTSHTLPFQEPNGAHYVLTKVAASHPHNAVIELWADLGMPGLALGIGFALLVLRKAGRLAPPLVPFALGAWVAGLCLTLVAYDLWTDSLFAAFAVTGFGFALLEKRQALSTGYSNQNIAS
jgi:O-antigen ligase